MFESLLRLYKSNGLKLKTPLEDFTTEILVGILNLEEDIKRDFIGSLLKLEENDYQIRTQVKFELENDTNCIIDIVVSNESCICFIENKVNSGEGERQLERYAKVLDIHKERGLTTQLVYCTKYIDPKPHEGHNFKQIRWLQIARFFNEYQDRSIVKAFIHFLKTQNMALELTMTTSDFDAFSNVQKTVMLMTEYLDRVKPIFESKFASGSKKIIDGKTVEQIATHNRFVYYCKDIISQGAWSEIMYGFHFLEPAIFVSVYVDQKNPSYQKFLQAAAAAQTQNKNFFVFHHPKGSNIALNLKISQFLNNELAIEDISNWFKKSFGEFENFINSTPDLDWRLK